MKFRSLWQGRNHPPAIHLKLPIQACPVSTPQQLLHDEPCPHLVRQIRELTSYPDRHWQFLALAALHQYCAFAQRLDDEQSLVSVLDRLVKVLRIRRSRILPPGECPETVARHSDQWTYAILTATLLQDIDHRFLNRHVEMFDAAGNSLGYWNPWNGPLCKIRNCAAYLPEKASTYVTTSDNVLLFASQIIPIRGIAWLASNPPLLGFWRSCLGRRWEDSGPLGELIYLSREQDITNLESNGRRDFLSVSSGLSFVSKPNLTGGSTKNHWPEKADNSLQGVPPDVAQKFLEWLQTALADKKIALNTSEALVFGLHDDLVLLSSPDVFKLFASAHPHYGTWETVQKVFQKLRLHRKNQFGSNIHRYYLQDSRKTINGYVMPKAALGILADKIGIGPLAGPLQ